MTTVTQIFMINTFIKKIIRKYGTSPNIKRFEIWKDLCEQSKTGYNVLNTINENSSIHDNNLLKDQASTFPCIPIDSDALIALTDGNVIDISKLLPSECKPELLNFNNNLAKDAFWRSTAFVVSGVMEYCFGAQNYKFGGNKTGFYCDSFICNKNLSPDDFPIIEEKFNVIVKSKTPFERMDIDLESAKSMYRDNPFKLAYLESLNETQTTVSVYRCGDIIDIAQSPLVRHTGQLRYLKLLGNGCIRNPLSVNDNSLQRIFGTSFPNENLLKQWDKDQQEAKTRDHRRIGLEQKLFFFHSSSTGSPFMLPRGTHICNKLFELIREQYWQRGFEEVTTPNIFNCDLWKTSGHWDLYQDNLFKIPLSNDEIMSLKPMNCPAHCLIYSHEERSYRSLPLRLADFSALHRNETSGSLSGLTRLRKFHQDDAHIFCRPDQVEDEISKTLDFLKYIYNILGFKYSLTLSTRPDKYLGEVSLWDVAEQQLKDCLQKIDSKWTINPGDGAFYGPKIDITITDAMGREHQCATIQLDFQLPLRFDLKYTIDKSIQSYGRPVIIHRAILGSVERLLAIMIESNKGKWPFWLNPRQIVVVPVAAQFNQYAEKICNIIRENKFMCDGNLRDDIQFNRKIRQGQLDQYSCILVVGEKERDSGTVHLRTRDGKKRISMGMEELLRRLSQWQSQRTFRIEDDLDQ